jgi:hypothetical protein
MMAGGFLRKPVFTWLGPWLIMIGHYEDDESLAEALLLRS